MEKEIKSKSCESTSAVEANLKKSIEKKKIML